MSDKENIANYDLHVYFFTVPIHLKNKFVILFRAFEFFLCLHYALIITPYWQQQSLRTIMYLEITRVFISDSHGTVVMILKYAFQYTTSSYRKWVAVNGKIHYLFRVCSAPSVIRGITLFCEIIFDALSAHKHLIIKTVSAVDVRWIWVLAYVNLQKKRSWVKISYSHS